MYKKRIGFSEYLSKVLKHSANLIYQNIFVIDSFKNTGDDIEVVYHINGKRSPVFCKTVTQIINDHKLRECFSRADILEIGIFYGQIKERKLYEKYKAK